jgi:hypothetical protein
MSMISRGRERVFMLVLLAWAILTFMILPVYLRNLVAAGVVGIAGFLALPITIGSGALLRWLTSPRYLALLESGQPAQASVLEATDRRTRYSSSRGTLTAVTLRVQVQPDDGEPYEAIIDTLLLPDTLPRVGQLVSVRYDPQEPDAVVLATG